ncbi:uncharacterized protein LOC107847013 isoform X2 [Capsicum annuum]|uniref:uncharacterized protein LOC107847013 isoform X2 n=1 Tax=Capsicum annuum TaxID=4072 RepID=UPI001FB0B6AD|nr:uncharacterized protein LOC107847013 isoform X2 [Capsicum annuum]
MACKTMILALVFFAMVFMASTIDVPVATALKDTTHGPIAVGNNNIIGYHVFHPKFVKKDLKKGVLDTYWSNYGYLGHFLACSLSNHVQKMR